MKDGELLLFRTKQGVKFETEVVASDGARALGLSYRDRLPPRQGLFFFYADEPQRRSMWMPNMRFPLDIIWLDGSLKIVNIRKNVQPCPNLEKCPRVSSVYRVQHAIELVAGEADDMGLRIGDKLTFLKKL